MNNKYQQDNCILFERLQQLILNSPDTYSATFKRKNKDIGQWVYQSLPLLSSQKYTWATRCYWILNNLTEFPQCCTCGKKILRNVHSVNIGYRSKNHITHNRYYCCLLCARINKDMMAQRTQTVMKHYGVPHQMMSNSVKLKQQNTCLEKYGKINVFQTEDIVKKSLATKRLRYNGHTCSEQGLKRLSESMGSFQRQEKIRKSCHKRLNVDYPFQNEKIRLKSRINCYKNNGYYFPIELNENRQKNLNKYYYNNIKFDSSWELAFYIWLQDHNYKFIYQCESMAFTYIDAKNKQHQYIPDFYLYDFDLFIELKGDYFFSNNFNIYGRSWKEKYNCMVDNNIVIFKYNEIKEFLKYITDKYGKTFLKEHKKCKV